MADPPPNVAIPDLQHLDLQRFETYPLWKRGVVRIGTQSVMTDVEGRPVGENGKPLPPGDNNTLLGHSVCTGFIINGGLIVTVAHGVVIKNRGARFPGFRLVNVEITDVGGEPLPGKIPAEVLAVDTGADLALLRCPAEINDPFIFRLAAGNAQVGQSVHTFGHPTHYPWDFRTGFIAHTNRKSNLSMPNRRKSPPGYFTLEVDFIAPPGFSGGPVITSSGEVVGVNQSTTNIEGEIRAGTNNFTSFSVPVRFVEELLHWYYTVGRQRGREVFMRNDGFGQFHRLLVEYARRVNHPALAHVVAADDERVRQGFDE